ncbi:hypothetical protein I317_03261 [Kwoniella heveanensis CBS 569]|nr:hypothetical protein I317_03261 [Kwoniella heveanensis CBS 569]
MEYPPSSVFHYPAIYLVKGFGTDYAAFNTIDYIAWFAIWDVATVSVAQLFFTERAYRLNGNKIVIPMTIGALILASCSGTIAIRVIASRISAQNDSVIIKLLKASKEAKPFLYLWVSRDCQQTLTSSRFFAAETDATLAAALAFTHKLSAGLATDLILLGLIMLGLRRSRTGWTHTDHLIQRLVRVSVESQLPGTLVALAYMIQFGINPNHSMTYFFSIVQPKVYAVSFMAALNARLSMTASFGLGARASTENRYIEPVSGARPATDYVEDDKAYHEAHKLSFSSAQLGSGTGTGSGMATATAFSVHEPAEIRVHEEVLISSDGGGGVPHVELGLNRR